MWVRGVLGRRRRGHDVLGEEALGVVGAGGGGLPFPRYVLVHSSLMIMLISAIFFV